MGAKVGTQTTGIKHSRAPLQEGQPLAGQLVDDACSFEFFQAVTLLQRLSSEARPVGGFSNPEDEAVHFKVHQRLAFPASQIQALGAETEGPQEMTVNFMGLTGPMGILPYSYSELILERARAKDTSLSAFLDIFNHRAISLFYRAWAKSRFPVTYSAGSRDLFTRYLLDLIGLGTPGLQDRQDVPDEALLQYISLIGRQSRSAAALEQVIADYFQVPVEIEQFTGAWYSLDRATQCSMTEDDSPSHELGGGAMVGDAIWERQARVRIRLGPLSRERYSDFLPGAPGHAALRAITRFFDNDCIDFEVQLVIDRTEAPGVALDFDSPDCARLGWISWVKNAPMVADPDNTILNL